MEKHIDWAALTDHNTTRNLRPFERVFQAAGVAFLPGIEIQTIEDIHVLGYFPDVETAEEVGLKVEKALPEIEIDPEKNGYQLITDESDAFQDMILKPYGFPTTLTLDQTINLIEEFHGIPVYAHVERAMGVIVQLGLIPQDPPSMACELYMLSKYQTYEKQLSLRTVLSSSDSHNLDSFSEAKMMIKCNSRSFEELKKAIQKIEGREVVLCR